MYSKKKIYILIFLSFILSVALSSFYITKYDKYRSDGLHHLMIHDETLRIWTQGAKIVNDVKSGENFFLSGDVIFSKPLPERLVAIYLLLSGHEIFDDEIIDDYPTKIKLGGKLPFLVIQSLAYYLALVYLVLQISRIFPIKNCFYIVFFLTFEHTIFQYHSSFWTESFYFTLQILVLSLLLKSSYKIFDNLLIGICTGMLFLQRSVGIFYLMPIIVYFIFSYKKKSAKPIIASVIGYTLIVSLLGIYNYKKTDVLYFFPTEGKRDVYNQLSINVLMQKNKASYTEISKQEIQKIHKWIKDNNLKLKDELDLDKLSSVLHLDRFFKNEEDKIKFYDYINKRQYKILIASPLITIKEVIINTTHFSILDPIHIYYYNEHRGKGKEPTFINSQIHKKWIPYRIIYTLLIYLVCFFGLVYFLKQKNYRTLLLLSLSILYYIILIGWTGSTRHFVPNLMYLSFFFGNGIVLLIKQFEKKKSSLDYSLK